MVDDYQNGIKFLRCGEVSDEIHGTLGKGTRFGTSFDREETGMCGLAVDFELLAVRTALDKLVYKMSESGDAPDARTPYENSRSNNEICEQT
jgi:hypothetical protein